MIDANAWMVLSNTMGMMEIFASLVGNYLAIIVTMAIHVPVTAVIPSTTMVVVMKMIKRLSQHRQRQHYQRGHQQ